jgi:hypothetical protein
MRSLLYSTLLCAIGTAAQQNFMKSDYKNDIQRQLHKQFTHSFLSDHVLQQQNSSTVDFTLDSNMSIGINVGSDSLRLSLCPMIHLGFSGLYDDSYKSGGKTANYSAASSNTSIPGANNITSLDTPDTGLIEGKAIKDTFCSKSNIDTCLQNNS